MLQKGCGRIINTASMASLLVPHPQKQIAYNASKAAVVKITETLGAEWADRGLTVNCMSPGIVNTALIQVWHWTPVCALRSTCLGYDYARNMACWMFVWVLLPLQHTVAGNA